MAVSHPVSGAPVLPLPPTPPPARTPARGEVGGGGGVMDADEIYGDLSLSHGSAQNDHAQTQRLTKENELLKKKITLLEGKVVRLQEANQGLERNISSVFVTAKQEIDRLLLLLAEKERCVCVIYIRSGFHVSHITVLLSGSSVFCVEAHT